MSTLKELNTVEDNIKKFKKRMRKLELTLQLEKDEENQKKLQQELDDLKQLLETQETSLGHLRRHNRQNGFTALFIMLLGIFLFYFTSMLITQLFLPANT